MIAILGKIVGVAIAGFAIYWFIRFFTLQVRVLFTVVRPFDRESGGSRGPRDRLGDFISARNLDPEKGQLRTKWLGAFARAVLSFVALSAWILVLKLLNR